MGRYRKRDEPQKFYLQLLGFISRPLPGFFYFYTDPEGLLTSALYLFLRLQGYTPVQLPSKITRGDLFKLFFGYYCAVSTEACTHLNTDFVGSEVSCKL